MQAQAGQDAGEMTLVGIGIVGVLIGASAVYSLTSESRESAQDIAAKLAKEQATLKDQKLKYDVARLSIHCPGCDVPCAFKFDGYHDVNTTDYRTVVKRHYDSSGDYVGHSEIDQEVPLTESRRYGHHECPKCGRTWRPGTDEVNHERHMKVLRNNKS